MQQGDPLLRPAQAAKFLGLSRASLYRYEAAGRLPHRLVIGPGASGWRLSDLERFLDGLPRGGSARRGPRAGSGGEAA